MKTNPTKSITLLASLLATHMVQAGGVVVPMYVDPAASVAYIGRYSNPANGQLVNTGAKPDGSYYTGQDVWGIVASGASIISHAHDPYYRDYFVIANGPAKGPFPMPFSATVKNSFDAVRTNGGKIFGYVHTLTTPSSQTFRSLSSVEADITTWATGYGHLDGIFIDEFSPYYEVNGANPGLGPSNPNPGPNGQINPTGGYYDRLTGWIYHHYPNAIVIVNPGGRVFSNQYLWNNLADVSCTFENSLATASADNAWYAPPSTPWGNLAEETTYTNASQAALIHTNTTDMFDAIDKAFDFGYDYVYTVQATPSYDNTWGIMPSYYTSMLQQIASY